MGREPRRRRFGRGGARPRTSPFPRTPSSPSRPPGAARGRQGSDGEGRITYRVRASAFHDNTRMTAADAVYAYIFAARWGGRAPGGAEPTPRWRRRVRDARKSLAGFKVVRVDTEVKKWGDLTFTYVVPVVDVYLDAVGEPEQLAAVAPPWSPVPWPVMVLMEEAVKRGVGAFSADEARRNIHWLDLARDAKVKDALAALVDGFARESYVPEPCSRFVAADEAQARWTALREYCPAPRPFPGDGRAVSAPKWSDGGAVLEVFRDFTQSDGRRHLRPVRDPPAGLRHSHRPARRSPGDPAGDRARGEVSPQLPARAGSARRPRRRRTVPTSRCAGTRWWPRTGPWPRGHRSRGAGHRLIVSQGPARPGSYTALVALSLGDNDVTPEIVTAPYRVEGTP